MSFPEDPRDLKVSAWFGHTDAESLTLLPFTQVSPDPDDEKDPGPVLGPIRIKRGRTGDSGTTDPTSLDLGGLRNTAGEFSRRNVSGSRYGQLRRGTPWRVAVDVGSGDDAVATASMQDFTPQRRGPGIDLKVPANAEGILARLGRDQESLSPLTRTLLYNTRFAGSIMVGYWPMEDPDGSGSFASGRANDQPITVSSGVEFAAASDLPGSAPLPVLSGATGLSAPISGPFTSGSWHFQWFMKFDALPATSTILMDVRTTGGDAARWVLSLSSANLTVTSYSAVGAVVLTASASAAAVPVGEWVAVRFLAEDVGDSLQAHIQPADFSSPYVSVNVTTVTLAGTPTQWLLPSSAELADVAMGQVVIFDSAAGVSLGDAALAYDGERAMIRVARLLGEVGIDVTLGPGDESELMGPQPIGTLMPLVREAEAVDGGVLYEARDGTLVFQSLEERYNAAVALTLAYGTEDDPGPGSNLLMVDDDRDIANLVTVTRDGGLSATVEQVTGPVGTDPDEGIGARPLPRTLSLHEDGQAVHQAGWLLRHGTIDKPRYRLILNPYSIASLRTQVLTLDVGSRIQITGAPTEDHGPDTLDLIVEGEQIILDSDLWEVDLWCEPFEPFEVRVWGEETSPDLHEHLGRWGEPEGTHIQTGIDEDDTAITVDSGAAGLWTVDDDEFDTGQYTPLFVTFGGEIARVTDIVDSGGGLYAFTVVRSVNGVVKSHLADTPLAVYRPLIWAL